MSCKLVGGLFCDELLWDIWEFDADMFLPVKRSTEIEAVDVKAGKLFLRLGDNTVEEKFDPS